MTAVLWMPGNTSGISRAVLSRRRRGNGSNIVYGALSTMPGARVFYSSGRGLSIVSAGRDGSSNGLWARQVFSTPAYGPTAQATIPVTTDNIVQGQW